MLAGPANLTAAAASMGFRTMPPIEIRAGGQHDLTDGVVLRDLLTTTGRERVNWLHLDTLCTTFCRFHAVFARGCSRTSAQPAGDGLSAREVEGNLLLEASCRVVRAAMRVVTWRALENPPASLLWAMPNVQRILVRRGIGSACLVFCGYRSPS